MRDQPPDVSIKQSSYHRETCPGLASSFPPGILDAAQGRGRKTPRLWLSGHNYRTTCIFYALASHSLRIRSRVSSDTIRESRGRASLDERRVIPRESAGVASTGERGGRMARGGA